MGRIPETEIYTAFVRMYNKLKFHEGIILKPALAQLHDLNTAKYFQGHWIGVSNCFLSAGFSFE